MASLLLIALFSGPRSVTFSCLIGSRAARFSRCQASELGLRIKNGLGRGRSRIAQTNPVNAEIFDHPLDVIAGFGEGNALDPVDRIDPGVGWGALRGRLIP